MHLLIETGSRNRCRGLRALLQAGVLVVTAGCAAMHESPDFERHRLSQLVEPYDRTDVYYFDATFTPAYPDGDPDAEAVRMEWLRTYLETRGLCPAGFEVRNRRPFDFLEDNPARHDIRYEVACTTPPP